MKRQRSEKPGETVVDAQEDVLRQVLGEGPIADHPQDVVEDRRLVRDDERREGTRVTTLRLAEDRELRLGKWH